MAITCVGGGASRGVGGAVSGESMIHSSAMPARTGAGGQAILAQAQHQTWHQHSSK